VNKELVQMSFSRYYRNELFTLEEAIDFLWQRNLINVGELAEHAISRNGNLKKQNKCQKGYDFDDKSDSKYTQVYHYKSASYATVAGIKNKIGTLRVMVHEPVTNKNYYFKVPYKVYKPYTNAAGGDSLKIWFDRNGHPRSPTQNKRPDLWKYKCSKTEWAN